MNATYVILGAGIAAIAALKIFGGTDALDQLQNIQASVQQGMQKISVESGLEKYRGEGTKLIGATYSSITGTLQAPQEMSQSMIDAIKAIPAGIITPSISMPSIGLIPSFAGLLAGASTTTTLPTTPSWQTTIGQVTGIAPAIPPVSQYLYNITSGRFQAPQGFSLFGFRLW